LDFGQLALPGRLQGFRRMMPESISSDSRPAYFFFQLEYVRWLNVGFAGNFRNGHAIITCFRMNVFWTSENWPLSSPRLFPARKLPRKTLNKTDPVSRDQSNSDHQTE
jgi:hypothetical protein